MDNKSTLNTLLSLLLLVAILLSYSIEGVYPSFNSYSNISSVQQHSMCWKAKAQQLSLAMHKPAGVNQHQNQSSSPQAATAITYSCNISLQMIAVKKQKIGTSASAKLIHPPFTPTISSQVFINREPDPPQLG